MLVSRDTATRAPRASLNTSQAPSPRCLPPSSRTRDIPRHSEPGRRRNARNDPTKPTRSRRLTIWESPRPPLLCALGRQPGPGPRGPHRSPAATSRTIGWSTRARGERRILISQPMAALNSPLAASSSNRRSHLERAEAKHHRRAVRVPAAAARGRAGWCVGTAWRIEARRRTASGARRRRAERLRYRTGVHTARPPRQRSATRLNGST